jgi:HAD superfamily hydrolase (TIGR01490 family)
MGEKKLILFDFDGTLTKKDTLIEFIIYYKGKMKLYFGFFVNLISLFKYSIGLISNSRLKEIIVSQFFKGESVLKFNQKGEEFARDIIPDLLKKDAIRTLEDYIRCNDNRIIVVTASCSNWIKPWTDKMGIELIATELEVVNDQLTVKIKGKNCYGPEKVSRIKSYIDTADYDTIISFGDSKGDKQMLDIADFKYYKTF